MLRGAQARQHTRDRGDEWGQLCAKSCHRLGSTCRGSAAHALQHRLPRAFRNVSVPHVVHHVVRHASCITRATARTRCNTHVLKRACAKHSVHDEHSVHHHPGVCRPAGTRPAAGGRAVCNHIRAVKSRLFGAGAAPHPGRAGLPGDAVGRHRGRQQHHGHGPPRCASARQARFATSAFVCRL